MIDAGKFSVLGVLVNAIDYEGAVSRIVTAARNRAPLSVTALAVHGVMTGVQDKTHMYRLNRLDLVLPDGQPVRWALNIMHHTQLPDRVYGPTLMRKVCERAAAEQLPIFLYGSTQDVLNRLTENLCRQHPGLQIAGASPSRFRQVSAEEQDAINTQIRESGARIAFVGIGCPRQEVWAYENTASIEMPVLAVGAAFAFHAGALSQAPTWMQRYGLEWLFRLVIEPRRLWRRYVILNPIYAAMTVLQWAGRKPATHDLPAPGSPMRFG